MSYRCPFCKSDLSFIDKTDCSVLFECSNPKHSFVCEHVPMGYKAKEKVKEIGEWE